jgi:hypothetical protein
MLVKWSAERLFKQALNEKFGEEAVLTVTHINDELVGEKLLAFPERMNHGCNIITMHKSIQTRSELSVQLIILFELHKLLVKWH